MKLRFYIYLNEDKDNKTRVYPNYKDDIALETELENNQRFYRDKISGKIAFLNKPTKDFDFIMSKSFDTQYNLVMERSDDYGQTWYIKYIGKFFRTDCIINYGDKRIELQTDTVDDYVNVLSGLEKEFNLADLPIEIQGINLMKRPLIQIYIPGDEIVSCFLSGMTWEQEVRESTTDVLKLKNTYKFSFSSVIRSLFLNVDGVPVDATGIYTTKTPNDNGYIGTIIGSNGYKIVVTVIEIPENQTWETIIDVIRISDNVTVLTGGVYGENGLTNNDGIVFYDDANNPQGTGSFTTVPIYSRYLLDVNSINGTSTYPIPSEDLVENNRNYHRIIGYAVDVVYTSERLSDTPTEWGKNSAGKYFLPPSSIFGQKFYPIARSRWEAISYWFGFHIMDELLEVQGRSPVFLKDSYPIHSVINVLLKQFAPDITHDGTPEYSQFLYGETNPISFNPFRLFISQKTNILNIQYQNPAQKTPMTLQKITNMLRDCFRCFWYIEDKKLKIEHIMWFKNGGSYSANPLISYDTTQMINVRNMKPWSFATSEISFDKIDMPERFQFKWMEDVSDVFEGMPIEVVSRYVTPGKVEEINIAGFNSDIDYLLLNPSEVSADGFALMAAVDREGFKPLNYGGFDFIINNSESTRFEIKPELIGQKAQITMVSTLLSGVGTSVIRFYTQSGSLILPEIPFNSNGETVIDTIVPEGAYYLCAFSPAMIDGRFKKFTVVGEYELPFSKINVDGVQSVLQNGILAFTVLQPNYYVYDLPAKNVKINGVQNVVQTDRKQKQNINFPMDGNSNPMELVRTEIGLGQIDKISLNLHSLSAKTTLKYDTEQ